MRDSLEPWSLPWMVPVPLKADNFVSLFPEHKRYSVTTDLSAIGTFSDSSQVKNNEDLLWSDLHLNTGAGCGRQLGAGRSGLYKGLYLKGVGRTTLAANWHDGDRWHNSGHLLPSAAIQEFLVSAYFEAQGLQQSIVPCTGLLLKPITPDLAKFTSLEFRGSQFQVREIDRRFQAISLKDASRSFIRFPNILWAMNAFVAGRGDQPLNNLSQFVAAVSDAIAEGLENGENLPAREPARFIEVFRRASDQIILNLTRFRTAGVFWLATHNNHTSDGRFLDLEAVIVGARSLAAIDQGCGDTIVFPADGRILGVDVIHTARAVKYFCFYFRSLLEFYRTSGVLDWMPMEKAFADELARLWNDHFCGPDFWANSNEEIVRILEGQIDAHSGLPEEHRAVVHKNLRYLCSLFYESKETLTQGLAFTKVNRGPSFPLEPDRNIDLYLFSGMTPKSTDIEPFEFFADRLRSLYAEQNLDRLMNRILEVRAEILRTFGLKSSPSAGEGVRSRVPVSR
ncbi:MAG: hypothetical protein HYR96_08995 [Deltaproteobacteria bacterium]|nr:hypothetical protein [Deltaproteobacteria bacterium]MBI3293217.1 hypothetical protein [Deltaproteobacteria bacterium]